MKEFTEQIPFNEETPLGNDGMSKPIQSNIDPSQVLPIPESLNKTRSRIGKISWGYSDK